MKSIQSTGLAIALTACSFGLNAQEVSFTQGGEAATISHKQSYLDNFQVGGNSYYVTSFMRISIT